jgi:hypothetical protein
MTSLKSFKQQNKDAVVELDQGFRIYTMHTKNSETLCGAWWGEH